MVLIFWILLICISHAILHEAHLYSERKIRGKFPGNHMAPPYRHKDILFSIPLVVSYRVLLFLLVSIPSSLFIIGKPFCTV